MINLIIGLLDVVMTVFVLVSTERMCAPSHLSGVAYARWVAL